MDIKPLDIETFNMVNHMQPIGLIRIGTANDKKLVEFTFINNKELEKELAEVFIKYNYKVVGAYRHLDGTLAKMNEE